MHKPQWECKGKVAGSDGDVLRGLPDVAAVPFATSYPLKPMAETPLTAVNNNYTNTAAQDRNFLATRCIAKYTFKETAVDVLRGHDQSVQIDLETTLFRED